MHPAETKPLSPDRDKHLSLAADGSATSVPTPTTCAAEEEVWQQRNQRRLQLIDKEFSETLGLEEGKELAALQAEFEERLGKVLPLPFDVLGELKTCARREGLLPKSAESAETVE
jgi:hypothetical protein